MQVSEKIVILDYGSQYTKLIARRIRDMSVYSEIIPFDTKAADLDRSDIKGIILSGGPQSVFASGAPQIDPDIFNLNKPILGICYGMQLICHVLGGRVEASEDREYGPATLKLESTSHVFFEGLNLNQKVWMSHGDRLLEPPSGFRAIGSSDNAPITAMAHRDRPILAIQFHPEVSHTEHGAQMLSNFVFKMCSCRASWKMFDFIEDSVNAIREKVGDSGVLLGLSGGVDSSVAAVLIHRAIGDQLTCVFVDHGMMRKDEMNEVVTTFRSGIGINLIAVDASNDFLGQLKDVDDPEEKRKIIGRTFIEVFDREASKLNHPEFLAQGTLYPDVIESATHHGPAQTIKSHHNVGGLPDKMNMKLLEPLRDLFKDEVRQVGRILGLPDPLVSRHPFPGPGLAVRILGAIDRESVRVLQEADDIFIEMLRSHQLYDHVSQAFAVLLPVKTVGIMGDNRTYERVCALRSVSTNDFMTADWSRLPHEFLAEVSTRIVNEVAGINRVVYDITSKPPGTIEWE